MLRVQLSALWQGYLQYYAGTTLLKARIRTEAT
jgi:hypothetical protein